MSSIYFIFFLSLCSCKPLPDSSLGLNEVAYHEEPSHVYLGSPSIVRLSSGRLLASHDFFGPGTKSYPQNVSVYSSDDDGVTWTFISYILRTYFTTLTVYNDRIYAIGIRGGKNDSGIVIHRSIDNGASWNYNQSDEGVLLFNGWFDSGAMPIVTANQMMYRTVEYHVGTGKWPYPFQAAIISCNLSSYSLSKNITADDPIMSLRNWKITPPLPFDTKWLPKTYPNLTAPGFLEGNIVVLQKTSSKNDDEQLRILNVLRFNSIPLSNLAIILELNQTLNTLSFISVIHFPGGMSKFTIRFDPITQIYITLCNPVTVEPVVDQRNILSLSYTNDLEHLNNWHIAADRLLYDDTGLTVNDSLRYTGFHYVDWQFDRLSSFDNKSSCSQWNCDGGPDMIYLVRTGYRGANSYHNSNRITYKTLPNYRAIIKQHQLMLKNRSVHKTVEV
ncbi:hypothetical protein I4U23_003562 [Adineta vaga]|nr:hypothetical protein I4U23_003562 [Adineta vaga]